ncbi:MAG: hypothetical protein F6K17_27165 [Okeania sp. SIO3C4]|nr:hypothetical protein [Okeania sp. SIO3B3]NER06006.1 hypothetical protein [Okeania sp. SIO3C4]
MKEKTNTIILDMGGTKSKELRDLRKGKGKMFRKIGKMLENMKAEGVTPPDIQPVIVIVKKKSKSKSKNKGIFG